MSEQHVHPIQAMIDDMNARAQAKRSVTQMTLGGLMAAMEVLPRDRLVAGLGSLDSYRGYYCDLAFEPSTETRTVGNLLTACHEAVGAIFSGCKGGDYVMDRKTPLWVAPYGDTGWKLMGLDVDRDPIRPITNEVMTHE